jgi:two-component system cell cycle response regulator CpdR
MRSFIAAALEKAGHRVTPCADGAEALTRLENNALSFDLLLTDIVMPGLDGIELSGRACALRPSLKVMFITGFAGMATGRTDTRNPHMRIVSKPFHLGRLIEEVNRILQD